MPVAVHNGEDGLGLVGEFGLLGQRGFSGAVCLATAIGILQRYNFEAASTWAL